MYPVVIYHGPYQMDLPSLMGYFSKTRTCFIKGRRVEGKQAIRDFKRSKYLCVMCLEVTAQ